MLGETRDAMADKKIEFTYDESVPDYLVEKGYSVAYGARNLRRLIQREIEDAVATEMVDRRRGNVSKVFVTVVDGKVQVKSE